MEAYYFQQLNKEQQHIYHAILKGVQNLENEFLVPACDREMLYNLFFRMRLDHPEIFWVSSYKYRYYKDSPNLIFIPEYLFDKKKICEHQKAMTARVEKLIRPAQKLSEWEKLARPARTLSEWEKEKYIHDFICENIRYDYFNLDDSQIFRDHEPLIAPVPHCGDHEHFYYKEKKLSFTKKEDVYKRSLQAVKKGRVLIFHWRGGYLTKEVLKELLELIRKAGDEKDKTAMVSINWPQAVIRVQYTDMQVQESVTIEEANEGEK